MLLTLTEVRQKLADARQSAGMPQSEAAAQAGVSQPFWHQVENVEKYPDKAVSPETLSQMAAVVGLQVEYGFKVKKLSRK